jgi:predicted RNA-binding Zn ribbon-like protein
MTDKHTAFTESRKKIYDERDKCPLDGDVAVLRFVNTLHQRATEKKKEYLKNYDSFLDWALDAELVEERTYKSLCAESYCYFYEAGEVFKQAINFRECLNHLVLSLIAGVPPGAGPVNTFNQFYTEVKAHRSFNMNGYGMLEIWVDTDEKIAYPLWKIIKMSKDFLSTVDGKYIKQCQCGNVFLDRSKNGKRRWCNGETCGSAYWSKQYYGRRKVGVI